MQNHLLEAISAKGNSTKPNQSLMNVFNEDTEDHDCLSFISLEIFCLIFVTLMKITFHTVHAEKTISTVLLIKQRANMTQKLNITRCSLVVHS